MSKANRNVLPRSEAGQHIKEKKYKRAIKRSRLRPLKNFLFWLFGVLSSFGIIFGSVFIALKVIPMSNLIGKENLNGVVSEDVANNSVLDFVLNINKYGVDDFPIIEQKLSEALGGKELGILSEYQQVDTPELEKVVISGQERYKTLDKDIDCTKYYCESDGQGASPMSTSPEKTYVPAFDNNGLLIASLSEKVKKGESIQLYYQPLTNLPVTKALSLLGEYIKFVPVSDILNIAGVEEGTFVNDIFNGILVGDFMKTPEQGGFSAQTILDNVSLEALGGTDMLGDLGNFEFFKSFVEVVEMPEVDANGFITKKDDRFTSNPAMYYIEVVKGPDESKSIFARAFTDEGEFIKEYFVDAEGNVYNTEPVDIEVESYRYFSHFEAAVEDLRYANLSRIPFSQAFKLLGESIGRQTINGMFEGLGVSITDGSIINDVFGEYAIEDFTKDPEDGGFDINTIQLTKLLGEIDDENRELYDLLCAVVSSNTKITAEELTVGHLLTDFNFDGVLVGDFISLNDQTIELLCSAINPSKKAKFIADGKDPKDYVEVTKDNLTIGDLQYISQDNIKLSTILGDYEDNKQLYDVILSAKGMLPENEAEVKAVAEALEVSALSGLTTDNIQLTVVLQESGNEKLYEILLSSLTITDKNGNPIENPVATDIKIAHLNKFTPDNIKLSTVLELPSVNPENETIYKIISEAIGGKDYDKITVADLNRTAEEDGFDIHNVKLSSVLDPAEDEALYNVLAEIYPHLNVQTELTIKDLSNFDLTSVKLATVLGEGVGYDNEIVAALLKKDVSVSGLSAAINELSLYEVYGEGCFVPYVEGAVGDRFTRTEDGGVVYYELSTDGEYVISSKCGMWLLLCFDMQEKDATGKTTKYASSTLTMDEFQEGGTKVSEKIMGATIRQLVNVGIIDDGEGFKSELIYTYTIKTVLENLDNMLAGNP